MADSHDIMMHDMQVFDYAQLEEITRSWQNDMNDEWIQTITQKQKISGTSK